MAINTVALADKMTGVLERAIVQKSVTGFMTDNAWKTKFVGAGTVLVPYAEFSGMGNYSRDNGFVQGSVNVGNTAYELTMDRGRSFQLDAQDDDESGITDLAGKVIGEFMYTQVVPEIDAYTLSKMAAAATAGGNTVTGTMTNGAFKIFTEAANKIYDRLGYDVELVAFVNSAFKAALESSTEFSRQITVSDFKQGEVNLKVQSVNGIALRPVAAGRMKTAFTFRDGVTAGQEAGGFTEAAGAKNIGLLMMAKAAGTLVKKVEKTRVFAPDLNQKADAWKFDVRMYYDAFVKRSMSDGIVLYSY